jgi:Ca2+-transporting ATPase
VLALAYRPLSVDEFRTSGKKLEEFETELVFLGLIGLIDPPRLEVREAIGRCKEAGIKVCMITGDHPLTALAIAQQLGIADKGDDKAVLKGSDIDAVSTNDLDLLASLDPFPTVFARVSPQHKLKIVQALKLRNEICAMTGDGVNDAPAIKQSHVGVAMGLTGTDLTKDAADIILTDDNFSTIVSAVKEGRHIYDNIKKFILYLLSCNSAEIYVMLLCGIIGLPVPFTPIMILWVNLIADIPPALSLGVDPPEHDIMTRLPRDPRKNIFNWKTVGLLLY